MSPSIENTPSVTSNCRRPSDLLSCRSASAWSASLCSNTLISARESLAPSMIDAWFRRSLTITSCLSRIAATVPAFAVKPDWNISASSACLNAANRRSSSRCTVIEPAIVRTAPVPAPSSLAAFAAAAFIRGWFARPR